MQHVVLASGRYRKRKPLLWIHFNAFILGALYTEMLTYDVLGVEKTMYFNASIIGGQHFHFGGATASLKHYDVFQCFHDWGSTLPVWGRHSKPETLTYDVLYAKQDDGCISALLFLGALVNTRIGAGGRWCPSKVGRFCPSNPYSTLEKRRQDSCETPDVTCVTFTHYPRWTRFTWLFRTDIYKHGELELMRFDE